MKEKRISQILEELAEQGVPEEVDLWPALRAQVESRARPTPRRSRRPAALVGWTALALAILVVLAVMTYGAAYLVGKLLDQGAGQWYVGPAWSTQRLDLSQTREGITVVLEDAYADSEQVVVGLVISSTGIQRYVPYQITLTNDVGVVLAQRTVYCIVGRPDLPCYILIPGEREFRFAFDSPIAGQAPLPEQMVDLRLVIKVAKLASSTYSLSVSLPDPTITLPDPWKGPPAPLGSGYFVGPFTFDFSVRLVADQPHGVP